MQVLTFSSLTPTQRQLFFGCALRFPAGGPYSDLADMERKLGGLFFEYGETYLTLWETASSPAGGLGVIVRELREKSVAYITGLHVDGPEVAPLLRHAVGLLGSFESGGSVTVRVGMRAEQQQDLQPALEVCGFGSPYATLEMELAAEPAWPSAQLTFLPAGPDHLETYLRLHNAAFAITPNGATLTAEELHDLLAESQSPLWLQVGFLGGTPAAILHLKVAGDVGWIDTLGVDPALQGRGLGKAALGHAVVTLRQLGAGRVRLHVSDRNVGALGLYRHSGFVVTRVLSCWLESPLDRLEQHFAG